jgi:hypothetical protein
LISQVGASLLLGDVQNSTKNRIDHSEEKGNNRAVWRQHFMRAGSVLVEMEKLLSAPMLKQAHALSRK